MLDLHIYRVSCTWGICLRLPHRLHCRPNQMGMLTIATQATLSVQPDGHAYDCHSGYNFSSARLDGRFSQTGTLTIATRAGQSSQTGMLTIAERACWSSQTGMFTIAARAGQSSQTGMLTIAARAGQSSQMDTNSLLDIR